MSTFNTRYNTFVKNHAREIPDMPPSEVSMYEKATFLQNRLTQALEDRNLKLAAEIGIILDAKQPVDAIQEEHSITPNAIDEIKSLLKNRR